MSARFEAAQIRELYRDAHLLVLEKPVGLATTSPEGGPSLFELAREIDPRAPELHPLSRLDTQVSGLVTFARTSHANRVALAARRDGTLRRAYLALCARTPEPRDGEWSFAIAIDPRDPKKRRAVDAKGCDPGSKSAQTRYRVHAETELIAALDLWPITGRTHQLRVHASAAGSPLLGDVAYGGAKRITLSNGRILSATRTMLHCAAFRMPDPARSDGVIALSAPLPRDLAELWQSAGGKAEDLALRA